MHMSPFSPRSYARDNPINLRSAPFTSAGGRVVCDVLASAIFGGMLALIGTPCLPQNAPQTPPTPCFAQGHTLALGPRNHPKSDISLGSDISPEPDKTDKAPRRVPESQRGGILRSCF